MTGSTRTSVLSDRHRALGSELGDWNGMGVAWDYATDPCDEHDAVRTAAGLFDVSGLKKVFVRGPDAPSVVDHVITRNMQTITPGRSAYGPNLTEQGRICDDAIIFNLGDGEYMVVHGSGQCMERLQESAAGKNVDIEFDDDLHDISLQGPKAVAFLDAHTPADLAGLKYFHQFGRRRKFDARRRQGRCGQFTGLLAQNEEITRAGPCYARGVRNRYETADRGRQLL